MKSRLYYQRSTNRWLHRIDMAEGEFAVTTSEAQAHCAAQFGLSPNDVAVAEVALSGTQEVALDELRTAVDWEGLPPGLPSPSSVSTGLLLRPASAPAAPDPDVELVAAIEAVDTGAVVDPAAKKAIEDFKAALTGRVRAAAVKGRRP